MGSPLSILDYRQPVEFSMGEVIARTLSVLSRHFMTFALLVGIAQLIPLLVAFYLGTRMLATPNLTLVAVGAITGLLQFILTSFVQAIVVFAAFQDLRGRPVNAAESFQRGVARVLPIMAASILTGVTIGIGFVLCVAPGLIFMAMLAVVLPSCVVERLGPIRSMSRSNELTQGHWWPIIGVAAALVVINLVGSAAIAAATPATSIPRQLSNWVLEVLIGSFQAVYAAILYHDLRAVKEGIGIDEIASVFD